MLCELTIENVAIIESASLRLHPGLNVLTGETGAGKSIILDALCMALGQRTSREILRSGTDRAQVTAVFSDCGARVRETLRELEIDEENELILFRRITADGRSSCRVNGVPVSVSVLREIGAQLVNIHGQHDSQALFSPEKHYLYLDALAGNGALLNSYAQSFQALQQAKRNLAALETNESEKERMLDMLTYQIEELENADIRIGEREELQQKIALFRNSADVLTALNAAYTALHGTDAEEGGAALLEEAARYVSAAAAYFPHLQSAAEALESAALDAKEYASDLRDTAEQLELDPRELQRAEDRLDLLYRLGRKYGETEEEMLAFLESAQTKARNILHADEQIAALRTRIDILTKQTQERAAALSESRRLAGERFSADVCRELSFLDMPHVRFVVRQEKTPFNAAGADRIEFLLSANAGEEPRPLSRIASGGELSRIMLSIKNVLSSGDPVDTLIFDEIDAGVSGRAAQKVGQKLYEVSADHQVVCVTHLSQIAVLADAHLRISKSVRDEKTYTKVDVLDADGRAEEIARIGAGSDVTALQLENARALLHDADAFKQTVRCAKGETP